MKRLSWTASRWRAPIPSASAPGTLPRWNPTKTRAGPDDLQLGRLRRARHRRTPRRHEREVAGRAGRPTAVCFATAFDPDGNYVQITQLSDEHRAAMEKG